MKKILVIEDNKLNQDLIIRRLQKRGYEVLLASDGAEGLEMIRKELPDLILLDLSLPVIDGWDVAKEAKLDNLVKGIPIIALTAHSMPGDRDKAIEAGCDEYETKPVRFKILIEKIERLVA